MSSILNSEFIVKMNGKGIDLYIPEFIKGKIIGKDGSAISELERNLGVSIKVKTFADLPLLDVKTQMSETKKGSQIFISFPEEFANTRVSLLVGDQIKKYSLDRNAILTISDKTEARQIARKGFVIIDEK